MRTLSDMKCPFPESTAGSQPSLGQMRQNRLQTNPRRQKNTPTPRVADPKIERERQHLQGNRALGQAPDYWEVAGRGRGFVLLLVPQVWPDCPPNSVLPSSYILYLQIWHWASLKGSDFFTLSCREGLHELNRLVCLCLNNKNSFN